MEIDEDTASQRHCGVWCTPAALACAVYLCRRCVCKSRGKGKKINEFASFLSLKPIRRTLFNAGLICRPSLRVMHGGQDPPIILIS